MGKSVPPNQPAKYFGFVQSYDTKSTRRLGVVLQSHGVPDSQPLTFLSDGGETVRHLPLQLHPQSEHLLDWVHLTMRVTVLGQYIKGLIRLQREAGEGIQKKLASVKWLLWHGKVDRALDRLGDLDRGVNHFADTLPPLPTAQKSRAEVPHVYREQSGLHSQLWLAVSAQRDDFDRVCGVDG